MKKETVLMHLKNILMAVGAFFAGKMIAGQAVDIAGIVGAVVGVGSMIWSIVDKTATLEMIQAALKSAIIVGGSIAVSAGILGNETVAMINSLVSVVSAAIYEAVSKKKSQAIAEGKLGIADLKGVDEKKPELIKPNVETPEKKTQ